MKTILFLILISYIFTTSIDCSIGGAKMVLDVEDLEVVNCKDQNVCQTNCGGTCGIKFFNAKYDPNFEVIEKTNYFEQCVTRKNEKVTGSSPGLNLFKEYMLIVDPKWVPEDKSLLDLFGDISKKLDTGFDQISAAKLVLFEDFFILRSFVKACEENPNWKADIKIKFQEYVDKTKSDFETKIVAAGTGTKYDEYLKKYSGIIKTIQNSIFIL
jgi:hypothetical protein